MIEVLKQMQEALREYHYYTIDAGLPNQSMLNKGYAAYQAGLKAIAELESQEPVAWMHIMDNTEGIKANGAGIVSITQKRKHPFGKPGIDFSKSYPVTSTPLYTHPPQRTEQEPVALEALVMICVKCRSNEWGPDTPRKQILNWFHDTASKALEDAQIFRGQA